MPRITLDADNTFNHTLEHLVETTPATSKAEVIRNAVEGYNLPEWFAAEQRRYPDNRNHSFQER